MSSLEHFKFGIKRGAERRKLTVCRILRRGNDLDQNLTGTRLRHVYETKGDPAFGHKGSSLLDGSHFLRTSGALCLGAVLRIRYSA